MYLQFFPSILQHHYNGAIGRSVEGRGGAHRGGATGFGEASTEVRIYNNALDLLRQLFMIELDLMVLQCSNKCVCPK
jgi:hypothetical protein